MSGGGGKGGSETTKTEVPDWIKQPAIRNLQRAEDVQRIEYMPYRGPEVAAFNATQNAAMDNNIATAKAFGLLDPNSTLTATTGMPTPTDFNGFSGYSSMPIYDQALADTKAAQPEAVALYDSLFGSNAMAQLNASRGTGGRGGSITSRPSPARNYTSGFKDYNSGDGMMSAGDALQSHMEARGQIIGQQATGEAEARANYLRMQQDAANMGNQDAQLAAAGVGNYASPQNLAPITFTPRNVATLNAQRNAVATPTVTQVARAPGGQALQTAKIRNMTFGKDKNFPKNPLGGSY